MYKSFVLFCSLVAFDTITLFAQDPYYINALRFSQSQLTGSARTLGFAGAQTALGADMGSLSSNPAGLGFYRKSEYVFAPSFLVNSTNSSTSIANSPQGLSVPDNKVVFNINNMGISFCNLRDDIVESKWRGGTFSIGMTRVANYQNSFTYQGVNNNTYSSIADYITNNANSSGFNYNSYNSNNPIGLIGAAYGAYVFSPFFSVNNNGDTTYTYKDIIAPNTSYSQKESVNEKGGMNEWTAAYGGNYNNRLFFGASLALVTMRYERIRNYSEQALNNLNQQNIMTDITINDDLKARGTGVNLSLGLTALLNDYVRTGFYVKTPTYMGIRETYNTSVSADYANVTISNQPNSASKNASVQLNNYSLISPLKVSWGLALFANKLGFLSGDIEYLDYSTSYIGGSNKANYINTNQYIKQAYQGTVNYKIGGEIRLAQIFRIRGGYALFTSPWKNKVQDIDRSIRSSDMQVFTFGLGLHTNDFFIDFAYNRSSYTSNYSPYLASDYTEPHVQTNVVLNNIVIGGGIFF